MYTHQILVQQIIDHFAIILKYLYIFIVNICLQEEIGNFLKDILEPSPKIIRKPDVENTDFKKPVFSKKKLNSKILSFFF